MTDPNLLCVGCFREEPAAGVCPACSYDETVERAPLFLPYRTLLHNQFLVGRELGRPGGFGITYLAFDRYLNDRVAIKEYLPPQLASRNADRLSVQAHSTRDEEFFLYGLEAFNSEARTLARFRHPNIVRVRTYLEANGTAYLVMDYYEGETLEAFLERHGGRISEDDALRLMAPIFGALTSEVHAKSYLHRDISPQNVYLAARGGEKRPLLIDFGAARLALGDRSQSLSVVLKPGYAPLEQYTSKNQGPWTDVYACAATLYRAVTGVVPPQATDRAPEDRLVPPDRLVPGLSRELCQALTWGLAILHEERPQTMAEFQDLLSPPPPAPPPPAPVAGIPVLRGIRGELAGEEAPLDETLIIGREATMSNLVLKRGDLSRQHCALRFDRNLGVFQLRDLESFNGTFVEREGKARRLEPGRMVTLRPGDRFHLVDPDESFEVALAASDTDHAPTEDLPSRLQSPPAADEPAPEEPWSEEPRSEEPQEAALEADVPDLPKKRRSALLWTLLALFLAAAVTAAVLFL